MSYYILIEYLSGLFDVTVHDVLFDLCFIRDLTKVIQISLVRIKHMFRITGTNATVDFVFRFMLQVCLIALAIIHIEYFDHVFIHHHQIVIQ